MLSFHFSLKFLLACVAQFSCFRTVQVCREQSWVRPVLFQMLNLTIKFRSILVHIKPKEIRISIFIQDDYRQWIKKLFLFNKTVILLCSHVRSCMSCTDKVVLLIWSGPEKKCLACKQIIFLGSHKGLTWFVSLHLSKQVKLESLPEVLILLDKSLFHKGLAFL